MANPLAPPPIGTQDWYDWLNRQADPGGNGMQGSQGLGKMANGDLAPGFGGPGASYGPTSQGYSGLSPGNMATSLGSFGSMAAKGMASQMGPQASGVLGSMNTFNGYSAQQQTAQAMAAATGQPDPTAGRGFFGTMGDLLSAAFNGTAPGTVEQQIAGHMAGIANNDPNMVNGSMSFGGTAAQLAGAHSQFGYAGVPGLVSNTPASLAASLASPSMTSGLADLGTAVDVGPGNYNGPANTGVDQSTNPQGLKKGGPTGAGMDGKVQPSRPVPVTVHEGEFVLNAKAVKKYGMANLQKLNSLSHPILGPGRGALTT